jgi:hypothetical protein
VKDMDYRKIGDLYGMLYEKKDIKMTEDEEENEDHVITVELHGNDDDPWKIDLKDDHYKDWRNLLTHVSNFLRHHKNDMEIRYYFLLGLMNSEKLQNYLVHHEMDTKQFLNHL